MALDASKKFVTVTSLREDGFVAFNFALGEPELFVEMLMPASAFDEFCASNKVIFLAEQSLLDDCEENPLRWTLAAANRRANGE